MFICDNLKLLTFSYYLKLLLAINMTLIPTIFIIKILATLLKKKQINLINLILSNQVKTSFCVLIIFFLSFILHNTLNSQNNVCYIKANTSILLEYRNKENAIAINDLNNEEENKVENMEENKGGKIADNFLKETNNTSLNHVYIVDGVFFYPNYINGNINTYSGMNCPSNPFLEGYNNQYGYNNYFYIRLAKFIEEAALNGHKITFGTDGCRNYKTQSYYYKTMQVGRAAKPGLSLHGFGLASDLEFYHANGLVCPMNRNDISCPSMGWAHNNALRFGLTFPLLNASYKEDWHIEPINKSKY